MSRVLVNNEQLLIIFHKPVSVKKLTDKPVSQPFFPGKDLVVEKFHLLRPRFLSSAAVNRCLSLTFAGAPAKVSSGVFIVGAPAADFTGILSCSFNGVSSDAFAGAKLLLQAFFGALPPTGVAAHGFTSSAFCRRCTSNGSGAGAERCSFASWRWRWEISRSLSNVTSGIRLRPSSASVSSGRPVGTLPPPD